MVSTLSVVVSQICRSLAGMANCTCLDVSELDLAHRGRVEYDLTDLLLLSIRGVVALHSECLKVGLPGEKDE